MEKGREQSTNEAGTQPCRKEGGWGEGSSPSPSRFPPSPPGRVAGQFFKRRQGFSLTTDLTEKQKVEF